MADRLAEIKAKCECLEEQLAGDFPFAVDDVSWLIAEIEWLKEDADCDARLLEIMREHAGELGIKYDGDQEYLVAVKVEIEQLRVRVRDAEEACSVIGLSDEIPVTTEAPHLSGPLKKAAYKARGMDVD